MLTDMPQILPPLSPVAAEIRPYSGEGYADFLGRSVFSLGNGAFFRLLEDTSVTSSACNYVFLSFGKDIFSETDDVHLVTHEDVRADLEKVCFDLKLSKSALSEILGVSRQTIYDWLSGKNENFKPENISKVEWLSELAQNLDQDIQSNLWLWRNKKLSNGLTIKTALSSTEILPQDLAIEINTALNKGRNASRLVSKSQEASGKHLLDKSVPFANND